MEIKYDLNLDLYSQREIMDMLDMGAVTYEEVINARVAHTFFSDCLQKKLEIYIETEMNTEVI